MVDIRKTESAVFLQKHIRRCLTTLIDGTVKTSRKNPNYWFSKFSFSPNFWSFPIINQDVISACEILGIKGINNYNDSRSVNLLYGLLQIVTPRLSETLQAQPGILKTIHIPTGLPKNIECSNQRSQALFGLLSDDRLKLPGISLYLHGSLADGTTTAFSDVDDLIVVTEDAWNNYDNLWTLAEEYARLCRRYQDIDPFQHHGHFLITQFDLHNYDQSIMPLCAIEKGICLHGSSDLTIKDTEDWNGFRVNAENTLLSMENTILRAETAGGLSAFELKGLAGEVMILPAYLQQLTGTFCTKPEAIRTARLIFSSDAIKAIEWATNLRKNFTPFVENPKICALKIFTKLGYARRDQVARVFKKRSGFVSNSSLLGLSDSTIRSIRIFAKEAKLFLAGVSR